MSKQVKNTVTLTAKLVVSFTLDDDTYQHLNEKDLKAIAIAKAERMKIDWECGELESNEEQ